MESYFAHVPGLKIVMPGTPEDAAGPADQRDPGQQPDAVPGEQVPLPAAASAAGPLSLDPIPLGVAKVVREGRDVTLITYSAGVSQGLEMAEELDKDGISVEVVDVRTLVPLDVETIVNSVRKTSRAVVLHEAAKRLGYGAEIAATIQEEAFWHLDQPVVRIAAKNTPTPDQPAAGGRGDPAARGDRRDAAEGGEGLMPADDSSREGGIMTTRLVVLGGGPGGYAAALYAASAGLTVAMVEKEKVGGTCLHRGLHPGQGAAARGRGVPHRLARGRARREAADGGTPEPDWPAANKRKAGIVSQLHRGLSGLLKRRKVTVSRASAR